MIKAQFCSSLVHRLLSIIAVFLMLMIRAKLVHEFVEIGPQTVHGAQQLHYRVVGGKNLKFYFLL